MKRIIFLLGVIFSFQFSLLASNDYIVENNGVNIRQDSTISSRSLGIVNKGQKIEVLKEKYSWFKVILPEQFSCYVSTSYLQATSKENAKVKASNLNLRTSPSLESQIISSIPKNTEVLMIKKDKTWTKIKCHPHATGWIHTKFLKKEGQESKLSLFTKDVIRQLANQNIQEKKNLHTQLIKKGKKIVPFIEKHILLADKNTMFSLILVLTEIGKNNPELASYFLDKINYQDLRKSSVYLDIVQGIVNISEPKTAYFYLAENGMLSQDAIKNAYTNLTKKIIQNN